MEQARRSGTIVVPHPDGSSDKRDRTTVPGMVAEMTRCRPVDDRVVRTELAVKVVYADEARGDMEDCAILPSSNFTLQQDGSSAMDCARNHISILALENESR